MTEGIDYCRVRNLSVGMKFRFSWSSCGSIVMKIFGNRVLIRRLSSDGKFHGYEYTIGGNSMEFVYIL